MPIAATSNALLRRLRDLLVLLLAFGHLSVAVLHSAHIDHLAISGSTETVFSTAGLGSTTGGDSVLTERHCHGCFSVSPVRATAAWSLAAAVTKPVAMPTKRLTGTSSALDTPTPKA